MSKDEEFEIIGSNKRLITSLRSSGYKNPTYAIAELVDNSVDAKSCHIEIMCKDIRIHSTGRDNLDEIAILDDGRGMNEDELRRSLKFGDGKDAESNDLGKFGIGLPNASISQCQRVEIYSWTKSVDEALYTYIDVTMIPDEMKVVPKPERKKLPDEWKNASKYMSQKSGTLVIWSKIDNCPYKTSKTLLTHSTNLIARIYRKFIHAQPNNKPDLVIRTASFTTSNGEVSIKEKDDAIKPNDPLYLMVPSRAPPPWDKEPMFEEYGDKWEQTFPIKYREEKHDVTVRYSIVKKDTREGDSPGNQPYGKDAQTNAGISILRAGRELDLDTNIVKEHDVRDRWWGIEVEFPPALDTFFGVSYIKQSASNFSDTLKNYDKIMNNNEKDEHQTKKELEENGETEQKAMIDLIREIRKNRDSMRASIDAPRKGTRSKTRLGSGGEDEVAKNRDKTKPTTTASGKQNPEEERIASAKKILEENGYNITYAQQIAEESIKAGQKFVWIPTKLSGDQFFDVLAHHESGQIYIKLNTQHAAYKNLVDIVEDIPKNLDSNDAITRLNRIHQGLRLLIASWGQYEDETIEDDEKKKLQNFRISWGIILDEFLKQNSK